MTRCPERKNLEINGWTFPKDKVVLVSSTPAHLDETAWNCGRDGSKPLTSFWPDRFLIYPNDPHSGPQKPPPFSNLTSPHSPQDPFPSPSNSAPQHNNPLPSTANPTFSLSGMSGSWIPYGGGPRACPGRHFAKREIMSTCALMASMFDVEIACAGNGNGNGNGDIEMNPVDYGLGTLRPVDKVPFRIRRRRD